jgi:maltooligosyltrehalose trehalohydrolase
VVYNHFGPDGNYLREFSPYYITNKHTTDWGEAINFDGKNSAPVREYFISNAVYWIREYHMDGLRLDATQDIFDESPQHILAEIVSAVQLHAKGKRLIIIAENEPQNVRLIKNFDEGGYGIDALWNDDFHHTASVALTGRNEAYYTDYSGTPQEFISAIKWGFLFQGQIYKWQNKRRGTPALDIKPEKFILFIENHDQVANSAKGNRIHKQSSFGNYKAITTLLLLAPGTPMLFQGQEFAASSPFLYFADHTKELSEKVSIGRINFLAQFRSLATPEMQKILPDPGDIKTFERSKLNFNEREIHHDIYSLHKDLIKIRKEISPFNLQKVRAIDGAVLSHESFLLRFFDNNKEDKLLLINLGSDLHLNPAPEPLLAPPANKKWEIFWSSEDPKYGGCGTPPLDTPDNWRIPGKTAVILTPVNIESEL